MRGCFVKSSPSSYSLRVSVARACLVVAKTFVLITGPSGLRTIHLALTKLTDCSWVSQYIQLLIP